MQKKSCGFDKYLHLGGLLNLNIFPKCPQHFGKTFNNHGEIQHFALKSVGSKGLNIQDVSFAVTEIQSDLDIRHFLVAVKMCQMSNHVGC